MIGLDWTGTEPVGFLDKVRLLRSQCGLEEGGTQAIVFSVIWVFAGVLIVLQGEPAGSVKEDGSSRAPRDSSDCHCLYQSLRLPLSPRS